MGVNSILISGKVVRKNNNYWVLEERLNRRRFNLIRVLNLPDTVKVGDEITIRGSIRGFLVNDGEPKRLLGVVTEEVFGQVVKNRLKISGKIVAKGSHQFSNRGTSVVDLTVKVDDDTFVPVVVWGDMADDVNYNFGLGDDVRVQGVLRSRVFKNVCDGPIKDRAMLEVNAIAIHMEFNSCLI